VWDQTPDAEIVAADKCWKSFSMDNSFLLFPDKIYFMESCRVLERDNKETTAPPTKSDGILSQAYAGRNPVTLCLPRID
jgi:hypothetical protein